MLQARSKSMSEAVSVGVTSSEDLETSALSDCSLDIACSTVTQSASSPSEPDQESSSPPCGLMAASKVVDEAESNEVLSDTSTVSAENSPSTVSAPSSSELEQENGSRQHSRGLTTGGPHRQVQVKEELTVLKDLGTNCEMSYGSADVCQPPVITSSDVSNKDQIVISASNRVQNYLASLGLPGISFSVS